MALRPGQPGPRGYAPGVDKGDRAPDFELTDQDGTSRRLTTMLGSGPVVLYFYPAAMTPGCTKEGCHFRDLAEDFTALGAQRVGVSGDAVDRQKEFSDKHAFDFPLLADTNGEVAVAYGVKRKIGPLGIKRRTFVIDTDRTIIEAFSSEVRFSAHGDKALVALRNRATA
jgi:peroxiredoxin Q/BCP